MMTRGILKGMVFFATVTLVQSGFAATPEQIREAVLGKFTTTTRSAVGRLKDPGTILVVQKEGIRADTPRVMMKPSKIRDGELVEVGGGSFFGNSGHSLPIGSRLHLYRLDVKDKYVLLLVGTAETGNVQMQGNTQGVPFEAGVSFRYEQGISEVSPEQVLADINAWFKTEDESATSATRTVALNQTVEQVVDVLGPPNKRIELGRKTIFVYDDIKVIFLEGRVADVE